MNLTRFHVIAAGAIGTLPPRLPCASRAWNGDPDRLRSPGSAS